MLHQKYKLPINLSKYTFSLPDTFTRSTAKIVMRLPFLKLGTRSTSKADLASALSYCQNLVKKADRESYLCCLLLPHDVRRQAFVVKAFNCELSTLRDQVKNRQAGLGRLQFWQSVVQTAFDEKRVTGENESDKSFNIAKHPVAQALSWMVDESWDTHYEGKTLWNLELNKELFLRLIEARRQMAGQYEMRIAKLDDLLNQGEHVFGTCGRLILNLMDIRDEKAHQAVILAGQSLAIVNTMRSFNPVLIRKNSVTLPEDVLKQHDLTSRSILKEKFRNNDRLSSVCRFLVAKAEQKLTDSRNVRRTSQLPKNTHKALLHTTIIDYYLNLLKKADYNLYDRNLQMKNVYLPWQLWWAKMKRTY